MSNTTFSTQPYKGTRDFYPAELQKRTYIFNTWRKTLIRCGFVEYDTSIIENADLYVAKSGEELGSKQLYNFHDKGERHIALRPEMTPTLARIVANKMGELKMPLRWFSIPNCFRYERPQKGRLREFWQLNADIIGLSAGAVEVEMLYVIGQLFLEFGATKQQFKIMFNHRGVLDMWLSDFAQISSPDDKALVYAVLDDWYKASVEENVAKLSAQLSSSQIQHLTDLVAKQGESWTQYLEIAKTFPELDLILHTVSTFSDQIEYDFNPTIIRGLAYYTGLVFEAFDKNPENPRAMFGGGRYDDLLSLFGKNAPAIGVGVGDVTWENFLDAWNLWPNFDEAKKSVGILLSSVENLPKLYSEIISKLQQEGKTYDINYEFERSENKRWETLKKRGCDEIIKV